MGVTQEYFSSPEKLRIEDILLADNQHLHTLFSTLKNKGLQALCKQQTYRPCVHNEHSFEVTVGGSYKGGFCTVSLHQQPIGLKRIFLTTIGNYSLHDIKIFFPSEQYPGEANISYTRAWRPSRAKNVEEVSIHKFIKQTYEHANDGLLTRRQKKIIRFVEQGIELL